jgi:hypothetical protein
MFILLPRAPRSAAFKCKFSNENFLLSSFQTGVTSLLMRFNQSLSKSGRDMIYFKILWNIKSLIELYRRQFSYYQNA